MGERLRDASGRLAQGPAGRGDPLFWVRRIGYAVLSLKLAAFATWSAVLYRHFSLTPDFAQYHQAWYLIAHGDLNPYDTVGNFAFWQNHAEFIMWPLALICGAISTGDHLAGRRAERDRTRDGPGAAVEQFQRPEPARSQGQAKYPREGFGHRLRGLTHRYAADGVTAGEGDFEQAFAHRAARQRPYGPVGLRLARAQDAPRRGQDPLRPGRGLSHRRHGAAGRARRERQRREKW